ncbi:histidine phosphatase family protein [Kallotenue papyrolyticum]|uniref:histidine phosphatase family protein n=1 Tax=Kallotenue papyrolyticum TaxID=1325125 RepID=UPI0004786055|nr:histidine phosphatase family protein [Kallotenue papyrolyticum]
MSRHTDVWLVRHPQTDWNRARRYQSRSDRPLTALGEAQARALAHRLRRLSFAAIVTSGQRRCDAVVELVAAQQPGRGHLLRDARWREADHGAWEGLTAREVLARFPAQAQARWGDPWRSRAHGGESGADVWTRVQAACAQLLRDFDGGRVLIVTHATPIQLLLCALLGLPFERSWQWRIDTGSLTNLDLYPSGAIVRTINSLPSLRSVEHEPRSNHCDD